jgi:hypothetical protein
MSEQCLELVSERTKSVLHLPKSMVKPETELIIMGETAQDIWIKSFRDFVDTNGAYGRETTWRYLDPTNITRIA